MSRPRTRAPNLGIHPPSTATPSQTRESRPEIRYADVFLLFRFVNDRLSHVYEMETTHLSVLRAWTAEKGDYSGGELSINAAIKSNHGALPDSRDASASTLVSAIRVVRHVR
jgi:hypothetical protein